MAPGGYRWLGEGPWDASQDGPIYMVISIERQMIHVYSGDRLIGVASVSTGMKGHRTPTGDFTILQKRQWHRSNLYSNAPMPFMQRLTWDGIALHAGHNPGYPASHGCIRLPYAFARQLFALTKMGTLVEVTQARLSAALQYDSLVLGDPGSTVVTFGPAGTGRRASPAQDDGVPRLEVDPAIFG
ncbi:L,D-transpeptidase family protein [Sphingobium sp. CR2-8]|uniref:L,D-transpeptidase family protein n=1 Tax=Sphingobium sp. CR2-8 TaxID=1306534 RepID=UPI002DBFA227|nr:L,D-transpeptidase family protein [Sphingobium sp. CR2-8]MEC3910392.1 L,D-transpeptidase family protein [Sphingobium sp. CR2-8]